MKWSLSKIVPHSCTTPRFYGCAYYLVDQCVSVAYPIPLHKIIGWLRYLWIIIKCPPRTFRLSALRACIDNQRMEIQELRMTVYRDREHCRSISHTND
jgi:hypothetical protein